MLGKTCDFGSATFTVQTNHRGNALRKLTLLMPYVHSKDKVKEDFNKLYDNDCRGSMLQWDTFDQAKREELITKEENIIFDSLATFGTLISPDTDLHCRG